MKRSRADDQSTHRGRRQSKDRQIGESDKEDQMKQQFKDAVNSLGPYDVICGRGTLAFNNIGNRRFRELISMNVGAYNNSQGRRHKGLFIGSLVQRLQHQIGARFYKLKDGRLVELKERQIRQKVGHALRDVLAFQDRQGKQNQQSQKHQQQHHCFNNRYDSFASPDTQARPCTAGPSAPSTLPSIRSRYRNMPTNNDMIPIQGHGISSSLHVVSPQHHNLPHMSQNRLYGPRNRQFFGGPTHYYSSATNLGDRVHDASIRFGSALSYQQHCVSNRSVVGELSSIPSNSKSLQGKQDCGAIGDMSCDGIDLSPIPINEQQEPDEAVMSMVQF